MPQAIIVADRFHIMKQINQELDSQRKKSKAEASRLKNKLEEVKKVAPTLDKMHCLKEEFRSIFEIKDNWVEGIFALGDWLKKAQKYFPTSFGTIRRWVGEIIAYFDDRTTQGVVEGINNKLKLIKRRGYGFRNFDNFSLRCLIVWHFSVDFTQ